MVLLLAGAVVSTGALLQGAVGFGLGLLAAPLLALLDPALVPVPLIVLGMAHATLTVFRDGGHADWRGVGWVLLGRLAGTALGVLAVVALSARRLGLVIGLLVLGFVLLSALSRRTRVALRPRSWLLAGVISGAGSASSAISGPPLALLYQHRGGPEVRGTLGAIFVAGALIALGGLAAAGQVSTDGLLAAAVLLPFLVAGFALSGPARRVLDAGRTRAAVLAVAGISAVLLIADSLLG